MSVASVSNRGINFPLNNSQYRTSPVDTYPRQDVSLSDSELSPDSSTSISIASSEKKDDKNSNQDLLLCLYKKSSYHQRKVSPSSQNSVSQKRTECTILRSGVDNVYTTKDITFSVKTEQPQCRFCRSGYGGVGLLLECDGCQNWFHKACVELVFDDSVANQRHYCMTKSKPASSQMISRQTQELPSKSLPECSKNIESSVLSELIIKPEEVINVLDDDLDIDDICPVCELECTCGMGSNIRKRSMRLKSSKPDPRLSYLMTRKQAPLYTRCLSINELSIITDSDDSNDKGGSIKPQRKRTNFRTKDNKKSRGKSSLTRTNKKKVKKARLDLATPETIIKPSKLEVESDTNLIVDIEADDEYNDELESLSCVSSDFVDIEGLSDSSEQLDSDIPNILDYTGYLSETREELIEEPTLVRTGWESSSFEEYSDFPSGWSDTESLDSLAAVEEPSTELGTLGPSNSGADYPPLPNPILPVGYNLAGSVVTRDPISLQFGSTSTFTSTPSSLAGLLTGSDSVVSLQTDPTYTTAQSVGTHSSLSRSKFPSSMILPVSRLNQLKKKGKGRLIGRNVDQAVGSPCKAESPTIIPMDEVVDTEKLYSSFSSELDSKPYQEHLQALTRWDRIPIGTFRRSRRRTSTPKLSVSAAMKVPNSTLLSDHTLNISRRKNLGNIVRNHGCSPLLYPVLDSHAHSLASYHTQNEYEELREVNQDTDPLLALFCVSTNEEVLEDPPNTIERVKKRKRKRCHQRL